MKLFTDERIIVAMHRHGRRLILPAAWAVLIIGLSTYGILRLRDSWLSWVVIVIGAFCLLMGSIIPWIRWAANRFILTTHRAIATTGIGRRRRTEVLHAQCTGVYITQSVGQRLRRSGDITVGSEFGDFVRFVDVPDAQRVRDTWQELVYDAMPHYGSSQHF